MRITQKKEGLYLDPFAGSAISAFESVKAGVKAIAFDLNPLTAFLIEVFCNEFDKEKFKTEVVKIKKSIEEDIIYQDHFFRTCRKCGSSSAVVNNFKWDHGSLYEVGIECETCVDGKKERYLEEPDHFEETKAKEQDGIKIKTWYPRDVFHSSPSFSANFINHVGGNCFSDLWTRRNLYVIAKIFDKILHVDDLNLKRQLLFGFIQTIHLCTKMCVPRRAGANRPFSTSWGRSAYICSARQMEMNPLPVFYGSCLGKQSVESSVGSVKEYVGKIPKIQYVDGSNKSNKSKNFDIKYGIVDINTISDFIQDDSVDFIMTDPPYGGLVQYMDLSSIWLVWLKKFDSRFAPRFEGEITIKSGIQSISVYRERFKNGMKNLYKVLKKDGKIVFTFHNKEIKIWNAFLNAISDAGFKIEKVIHQQNRRTGESNVANPYGTSAADFYIRCIKEQTINLKTSEDEFEDYVVKQAIRLIAQRNEPTPYQILFNGLLSEISSAGFDIEDFDKNVESFLSNRIGTIFQITGEPSKAGEYWWFEKPTEYIKYPDKNLADRVEETISSFLRRKVSVTFDEVLGEVFVKYPNGLIPETKTILQTLDVFAEKSGSKWIYKTEKSEQDFTKHTEIIYLLSTIGKKMGYAIYIGKREQPEPFEGGKLVQYADIKSLRKLLANSEKRKRVEMIDMLWIKHEKIEYAIEVEDSTKFISAIQRSSNLDEKTNKIMVLPNRRKDEFLSIKDPMFVEDFKKYSWRYLFYDDVNRLKSSRDIVRSELDKFLHKI